MTYTEPLVARALGVNKRLLAVRRHMHLAKGADWLLENAVVAYTPDGLKKICAALRLDPALVEAAAAATGDAPEASAGPGEASLPQVSSADAERTTGRHAAPGTGVGGDAVDLRSGGFARRDSDVTAAAVAAQAEQLRKQSAPRLIEVTAIPGNPILLHGRLDGKPVTVRVRSNANFIPGLWVRATPLNGANYFAMIGNPPRWKGDRHGFTKPPLYPA